MANFTKEVHIHDRYGFCSMLKVPDGMSIQTGDKVYDRLIGQYLTIVETRHDLEDAETIYIAKAI